MNVTQVLPHVLPPLEKISHEVTLIETANITSSDACDQPCAVDGMTCWDRLFLREPPLCHEILSMGCDCRECCLETPSDVTSWRSHILPRIDERCVPSIDAQVLSCDGVATQCCCGSCCSCIGLDL